MQVGWPDKQKAVVNMKDLYFCRGDSKNNLPCQSRMPEQPNICMFREPHWEPDTRQQQAEKWRINSPQPITMHYTSVPVSSPIVIYSCPVIRACLRKKKSICLPRCFFLITSGIHPLGNHSACSLRSAGYSELFSAMMDRSSFVLLRKYIRLFPFGFKL